MTNPLHIHDLTGCAPAPLANYLKALAILRLVSEQADPGARGWWEGERFRLATKLSREELERFFLEDYAPTPILAPWLNGSGFYKAEKDEAASAAEKKPKDIMKSMLAYTAGRFSTTVDAIRACQVQVGKLKSKKVPKDKLSLILDCKREWRGALATSLEAAIAIAHVDKMADKTADKDGEKPFYSPLLGTGYNDGKLCFARNFTERLWFLFNADGSAKPGAGRLLRFSLSGEIARDVEAKDAAIGQFMPGSTGGANSTIGADSPSFSNFWDFVFTIEGAMVLRTGTTRFLASTKTKVSVPFTTVGTQAGFASAFGGENGKGEIWLPLWMNPCTLAEVQKLFLDGRAQLERKRATKSLDFPRSINRLGAAAGVAGFQRHSFLTRNGQAHYIVAHGRIAVPDGPNTKLECLADIEHWLAKLQRRLKDKKNKPSLRWFDAERAISSALYEIAEFPNEAAAWQQALISFGRADCLLAVSSNIELGTMPKLAAQWASNANDGTATFQLALSFAFAAARWHKLGAEFPVLAYLRHLPRLIHGRSAITDLSNVVLRRIIEASRGDERRFPIQAAPGGDACLTDIDRALKGNVDLNRVLDLACGLMAVDAKAWVQLKHKLLRPRTEAMPPQPWCAIRLAHLPFALTDGQRIPVDPAITRRLMSDDVPGAVELALRRLNAHGIRPAFKSAAASSGTGPLWAASLAFPISETTAARLLRQLDPSNAAQINPRKKGN